MYNNDNNNMNYDLPFDKLILQQYPRLKVWLFSHFLSSSNTARFSTSPSY